jgi:hypothetical protein
MKQIRWGPRNGERITFLVENYPTMTVRELTRKFNERFEQDVSEAAVGYQLHVHRIAKKSEASLVS